MNKKAISTVIVILVIGSLAVASLAMFSFNQKIKETEQDINVFEKLRIVYDYAVAVDYADVNEFEFEESGGGIYRKNVENIKDGGNVWVLGDLEEDGFRFMIKK